MASAAYHHKPNSLLYLISRPFDDVEIKEFSRQELEAFRLGPEPPRPVQNVSPSRKRAKKTHIKQEPASSGTDSNT